MCVCVCVCMCVCGWMGGRMRVQGLCECKGVCERSACECACVCACASCACADASEMREGKGARNAAAGRKKVKRESVWDERVLCDVDGCGVLGARALAFGRASVRIGSVSSGNGGGSSAAEAPASPAAEGAKAAQAAGQHWLQALFGIQQQRSAQGDQRAQRQQQRRQEQASTRARERHLAGCGLCSPLFAACCC